MSQENREEIVHAAHEAFSRGDREAFVAVWADECEYQPALERDLAGDEGIFRGHDGIRRWWQGMWEAFSEWSSEVHEVRDAGEQVLVFCTVRARGRESGAVIEAPFFQLVTIRGGKAIASRDFSDRTEALEAAGLRE
jgi:ketosteroid isomerase-like protein